MYLAQIRLPDKGFVVHNGLDLGPLVLLYGVAIGYFDEV